MPRGVGVDICIGEGVVRRGWPGNDEIRVVCEGEGVCAHDEGVIIAMEVDLVMWDGGCIDDVACGVTADGVTRVEMVGLGVYGKYLVMGPRG